MYLPGYADDDGPGVHRYWHPNWIDEHGPDATIDAVVRYVLEKSSNREIEDEMIAALVQERDEEAMRSEVQRQVESVRQRMQEQLAGQSGDAELLESFYRDYDELAGKYDQLAAENERLRQQRKELEDDNRSLNYRLSRQWEYEDAPPGPTYRWRRFSCRRRLGKVYENLDAGERVAVDSKLLAGLCMKFGHTRRNRSKQQGLCFVYPRGGPQAVVASSSGWTGRKSECARSSQTTIPMRTCATDCAVGALTYPSIRSSRPGSRRIRVY